MIFGNRRSRPTNWLKTGLDNARRVGRIQASGGGGVVATGFLLDGEMVDESLADLPLFLTCNHVIRSPEQDSSGGAISHEEALVVFEGMFDDSSQSVSSRCERVISFSPTDQLNYTLLLLARWPGPVKEIALAPQIPAQGDPVIILGYPGGRALSVSLEDNEVLGSADYLLYYGAPTEEGSSGSLVVNQYWEPVALHTGSEREHHRNYGRVLPVILDHARMQLPSVQLSEATATRLRGLKQALLPSAGHPSDEALAEQVDFFSVFISYSHEDSAFSLRLYNALQSSGVRAWLDKKQMLPGDDIYEEVHKGIRSWDKLLLCCSKSSLSSWWVDSEIDEAFQKERELFKTRGHKVLALISLDLDGFLLDEWSTGKSQQVKSRLAADFRDWKSPVSFEASLEGLLSGLRADAGARREPPKPKL